MFSFLPLINIVEGPFVHAHQIPAITISMGYAAVAPAVLVMTDPLGNVSQGLQNCTGKRMDAH